ncbi:DUF1801 domain-containing protein [Primorskyibacter sp. S87]|uniref:DUF1801 domain-containing protein n=1 Tax=Primorskyibacter sp. S87 TaxID=3415126 RepID=UPI003C7C1A58
MIPYSSQQVAEVFESSPAGARAGMLRLRQLILDTAEELSEQVEETLRWGQPAYIAKKGSTLRVGTSKHAAFALFVHCQSRLIDDLRATFPGADRLEGNRAVLFDDPTEIDPERHGWLVARALTYHQNR